MSVAIFISLFGLVLGGSHPLAESEKTAERLFRQLEGQLANKEQAAEYVRSRFTARKAGR